MSPALLGSLAAIALIVAGLLAFDVALRRRHTRVVQAYRAELDRERDRRADEAVAAERTRIAREMHDILAHNLSVMIALTDGAALTLDRDPERARNAITQAADTGRTAIAELRHSLALLRADPSDSAAGQPALELHPEPGLAEMESLFDSVRGTGRQVTYRTSGATEGLPHTVQLTVYRLVQESLTNAVKHSPRATTLLVSLRRGDADLRVVVDDDGGPAAVSEAPSGQGLIGMRERVTLHGGRLFAGSTNSGWRVSAWLPL